MHFPSWAVYVRISARMVFVLRTRFKCLDPGRYGMAPAQIPVLLTQKPSTENGIFPVWAIIKWV